MSKTCKYCKTGTGSHYCPPLGEFEDADSQSQSSGDPLLSAAIGAATGSTILGGLIGGSFTGALLGDALDGDIFDD